MSAFRVGLSADFFFADGQPAYPTFDLSPLETDKDIEVVKINDSQGALPASELQELDALILLLPKFTQQSVPQNNRLSVIARFGVGYDTVDVEACTQNDIALVTAPDGVRRPVATSVLAFMFALTHKLMDKDKLVRQGPAGWAQKANFMGTGLIGRTLGILGLGNIGAEIVRLAAPLGMKFIAHDPYIDPAQAAILGVRLVDMDSLFKQSDVLSINCPLNDETKGLVDSAKLALMKPSSYLINTARGPIVDQAALTSALRDNKIAGAGLDVFENEPTSEREEITTLHNVILAPHALCFTDQCFAGLGAADIRAVLAVMRGEVPDYIVNRAVIERGGFKDKLESYRQRFGNRLKPQGMASVSEPP